jgi:hypothetical protein
MSEDQFRDSVCTVLQTSFPRNRIRTRGKLLYRLIVDGDGNLRPQDYHNPRRDELCAFETDILVSNESGRVPLVVIETKSGGLNTDDLLAYFAKAARHKEVYPHLRYGLLIGDRDRIEEKFFVHNTSFDFALAVENIDSASAEIIDLVANQIHAANSLLGVGGMERIRKYVTTIELTG